MIEMGLHGGQYRIGRCRRPCRQQRRGDGRFGIRRRTPFDPIDGDGGFVVVVVVVVVYDYRDYNLLHGIPIIRLLGGDHAEQDTIHVSDCNMEDKRLVVAVVVLLYHTWAMRPSFPIGRFSIGRTSRRVFQATKAPCLEHYYLSTRHTIYPWCQPVPNFPFGDWWFR